MADFRLAHSLGIGQIFAGMHKIAYRYSPRISPVRLEARRFTVIRSATYSPRIMQKFAEVRTFACGRSFVGTHDHGEMRTNVRSVLQTVVRINMRTRVLSNQWTKLTSKMDNCPIDVAGLPWYNEDNRTQ